MPDFRHKETRVTNIYRPVNAPLPEAQAYDLDRALDAIDAVCAPPPDGADDLRRSTARELLRSAANVNAGVVDLTPLRTCIAVWSQSPDGFAALGLTCEDVAALIGADCPEPGR